ncbi:MAG: aminomethyltransferase beta-barrel domain-containing protein, partial [Patescibacteria group bacterium]
SEFPISNFSAKGGSAFGGKIGNYKLKIAKDLNKDQSYFLWTLTQEQLQYCLFPIGEYIKPQVRELARKFGLSTAEKPDSQGICFIGEIDLNSYLKQYIPMAHGRMVTTAGKDVGGHDGLAFYTIGQREGLKIGGGIPYYVAKKDFQTNTLVVACGPFDEQLFFPVLTADDVHWIAGIEPMLPLTCSARIRYRQPIQNATIQQAEDRNIIVRFDEPQRAITPGQSIVFYQNGEMLGGACIS